MDVVRRRASQVLAKAQSLSQRLKEACTCGTCKDCKGKKSPLKGKQSKLDADKDGKLEGSDFAALRKKKK